MAKSLSLHPGDILIVADEPVYSKPLTTILKKQGHHLQQGRSGEMALKMAGQSPPALILLAVDLPQTDGYALCEQLKAQTMTASIPIIFISPADEPLDRARVFAAGGADYLPTPFEAAEVVARVETQLALQAARSDVATYDESGQAIRLFGSIQGITERKEAEAQIQYLADLVDNVSDAIISTDVAFNIKSWNKAAEKLYGWRKEEVLGQPIMNITELRYPDCSPDEVVAEFFTEGQWRGEIIQTHRDGRELWVEASVSLLRDERGQPVGAVAINQDITERKRVEAKIKQQTLHMELAQQMARMGYWSFDITSGQPDWSDMMFTVMGWDPARGIPHYEQHRDIIHPDDWEKFDQAVQGAIAGTPYQIELRLIFPDNSLHYVLAQGYPQRDAQGNIISLFGTTQDITERKRTEESLLIYKQIFSSTPDPVSFLDTTYHYRLANDAYETYSVIDREHFLGLTVADYLGQDVFEEAIKPHFDRCLQGQIIRYQAWFEYPTLGRRYMDITYYPVRDSEGHIIGLVANTRDMTEQKQAEEALRQSEQRYRSIIENSADGIVLYNQAGAVVEWNQALAEITGIPQAEALGQMAWDVHMVLAHSLELTLEEVKGGMMAFLTGQESADGALYEYDIKDVSTGERRSLQTRMFSLRFDDELIIGNVVRDITAWKRTEETLRRKEAQYRLLAANLPETDVYLFDTELRFLIAEGPLMERGGITSESFEGQRLPDMFDQERRDFFVPTYQRALAGEHVKTDFTYGEYHYYHQVMPLLDEQGEIYGGIALTQDITERKLAEEALRESEEKFRTIAENVPGLVLRYKLNSDGSDELLFLSEGVEAIYEVPRDETLRDVSILWRIIHPDDLEAYMASVQASAEALSFWEREHRILLPDGRIKWLHGRGLPRKLADGSIVWDTLAIDITPRKQLELELIRARDEAEAANKAKSVFLANMSHELRTPLNGVLGYAQVLQQYTTLDSEQQRHVKTIEQSGHHLLTLINDVLDIAKIEAGKITLQPAPFDLTEFLTNLSSIIRVRAKQEDILFVTDFDPDLPSVVRGDEKRLRQILINLLGNAVKFTDEGQIFFTVTALKPQRKGRSRLRFTVKDTGQGIPAEELEKIFKPFHQAIGHQQFQEGTGLGLAISQHLARLMASAIQVESQPGQGSTFWLELALPVEDDTISTEARPQPKIIGFRGTAPTILVVDDVSTNREVLHNFLAALGFQVIVAEDGLQGVAMAETLRPDLILADLRMPRLDGYEMVRRLRQIEVMKSVPVIGISASVYPEDAQKSLAAGCNAFLPKPVDLDELTTLLTQYLTLEWIYQNNSANAASNPVDAVPFTMPPPEALRELQTMVDIGDIVGIKRQLAALEAQDDQYATFVAEITRLANSFEIGAIERILRNSISNY